MPFLVDSLTMELARQQRGVHVVVHPHFDVTRDITGRLESVDPVADGSLEPSGEAVRESWMHVEIDRVRDGNDADATEAIEEAVQRVLRDVREAVEDWEKMHAQVSSVVADLEATPPPLPADEVRQGRDLLTWLAADHFTFLGYREYRLEREGDDELLRAVPGTGLGILRADPDMSAASGRLPERAAAKAREKTLLVLAKANSRATVHRPAYLDYVGVKTFEDGEVVGERRFLGLFSSAAYTESLTRIPLLRDKAAEVLRRTGFDARSHAGKALMDTLETYPRDELFHTPVDELGPMAEAAMHARERRQVRVFVRRDTYGRYVSVLVYLPRDRYNTGVRERFAEILKDRLAGESLEFTVQVNESSTARVHFVVHPAEDATIDDIDTARPGAAPGGGVPLVARRPPRRRRARSTARRSAPCWPGATSTPSPRPTRRTSRPAPARSTSAGSRRSRATRASRCRSTSRWTPTAARRGSRSSGSGPRCRSPRSCRCSRRWASRWSTSGPTSWSRWSDRRTSTSSACATATRCPRAPASSSRTRCARSGTASTRSTGSTRWCCGAGLTWRQATVLRAYAKYMRQGNSPFALDYIEGALAATSTSPGCWSSCSRPASTPVATTWPHDAESRRARVDEVEERIRRALDDVASLDHDRILRSYLTHVRATLRTNYFQTGPEGDGVKPYMSFKLEPSAIPDLPAPRPRFEIFVYSPRVEGVHLRFGAVARGGLRWSDRRDDFRTEVLGLVKAQMVKNTVIVPVGAKGGFFCKQLPDSGQRDAWLAEGVDCYKTFISGLLDITDNLVDGETVAARRGWCATTATTPTSWSPPTRAPRRSPTSPTAWPTTTASGWATPSPAAARSGTTTRRWASPPAAPGSRCSGTSASAASTASTRTSPASASATCPGTCSATGCSAPSTPGWWRPSTTATSSSTPTPTRPRRTPSARGSSGWAARAGRTTTGT